MSSGLKHTTQTGEEVCSVFPYVHWTALLLHSSQNFSTVVCVPTSRTSSAVYSLQSLPLIIPSSTSDAVSRLKIQTFQITPKSPLLTTPNIIANVCGVLTICQPLLCILSHLLHSFRSLSGFIPYRYCYFYHIEMGNLRPREGGSPAQSHKASRKQSLGLSLGECIPEAMS